MWAEQGQPRDWLRRRRSVNDLNRWIMGLHYDLEGALEAEQRGLAWRSQEELLGAAVQLYLVRVGVETVRNPDDRIDRIAARLETLERVQPSLAAEAWQLWMRSVPPLSSLRPEIDRTLEFIRQRLELPWLSSRRDSVLTWADDTRSLRLVARQFGIAQTDDWYVTADPQSTDWYKEIITRLDQEESSHRPHLEEAAGDSRHR